MFDPPFPNYRGGPLQWGRITETSVLVENIAVDDLNLAENFLFT